MQRGSGRAAVTARSRKWLRASVYFGRRGGEAEFSLQQRQKVSEIAPVQERDRSSFRVPQNENWALRRPPPRVSVRHSGPRLLQGWHLTLLCAQIQSQVTHSEVQEGDPPLTFFYLLTLKLHQVPVKKRPCTGFQSGLSKDHHLNCNPVKIRNL